MTVRSVGGSSPSTTSISLADDSNSNSADPAAQTGAAEDSGPSISVADQASNDPTSDFDSLPNGGASVYGDDSGPEVVVLGLKPSQAISPR